MSSYLSQFNYQFMRPAGIPLSPSDAQNAGLRRFVFLHGLMGYGLNWRRAISSLGPRDIAFVFDQRGHGKSMKPVTGYAPEDYADDLELIRQEIGWDQFYLVGHSMGGRNALMYAHRFPERVKKLVIEDIGPEAQPGALDYYSRMLGSVPTPFPNKLRAKEFFLNEFPALRLTRANAATLGQYLYSNIIEDEKGQAIWRFSKEAMLASIRYGRAKDHWAELKSLTVPTLILRGADSVELSAEIFDQMLACSSLIQGVTILNAGHWIHSEQPDLFVRALLDFINE